MKLARIITITALCLLTIAAYADQPQQHPQQSVRSRLATPEESERYWSEHPDELATLAAEPYLPAETPDPEAIVALPALLGRGPASEIEGCKWCRRVEAYKPVYCVIDEGGPDPGAWCGDQPISINCASSFVICSTHWVPSEVGEKCEPISGTFDVSTALIGAANGNPSISMQLFLQWRLSVPPGGSMGNPFSAYDTTVYESSSCSSPPNTQTWTTTVGPFGNWQWTHQVKIWTCTQSGSACAATIHVQP